MPVSVGYHNDDLARSAGDRTRSSGQVFVGGSNPDQTAAAITRSQWQHFLDTYRPVEDEVLRQAMQTDFTAEGDEAGRTATTSIAASRGTLARNLSRAGTSLTGEERAAVGRRQNLSLAKASARAENTTRRGLSTSRENLLAGIVGIGRGVAQTASFGAQSVADMAAQRDQLYESQKSRTDATNISSATTLAGLLMAGI
jgi:hypothetical protein